MFGLAAPVRQLLKIMDMIDVLPPSLEALEPEAAVAELKA